MCPSSPWASLDFELTQNILCSPSGHFTHIHERDLGSPARDQTKGPRPFLLLFTQINLLALAPKDTKLGFSMLSLPSHFKIFSRILKLESIKWVCLGPFHVGAPAGEPTVHSTSSSASCFDPIFFPFLSNLMNISTLVGLASWLSLFPPLCFCEWFHFLRLRVSWVNNSDTISRTVAWFRRSLHGVSVQKGLP